MKSKIERFKKQAQDLLATHNFLSKKNIDELVDELMIHQVELQLQNDTLTEAHKENVLLRKQKSEAEEKNKAKDLFLATLSHELRTPITVILCWVHSLKNKLGNPHAILKGLDAIEENIVIQNCLISDLLDFSSIIFNKFSLELNNLNIVNIINTSIESVRPHAEAKHISIEFVSSVQALDLKLDATRMRQVFYNLLMNAIKFTPSNDKIVINADIVKDNVQIRIHDNGCGISQEFLPYLFDLFTQENSSYTSMMVGPKSGLGLGLALARNLVELQGGTIKAESAGLNQGATFTILFPNKN